MPVYYRLPSRYADGRFRWIEAMQDTLAGLYHEVHWSEVETVATALGSYFPLGFEPWRADNKPDRPMTTEVNGDDPPKPVAFSEDNPPLLCYQAELARAYDCHSHFSDFAQSLKDKGVLTRFEKSEKHKRPWSFWFTDPKERAKRERLILDERQSGLTNGHKKNREPNGS